MLSAALASAGVPVAAADPKVSTSAPPPPGAKPPPKPSNRIFQSNPKANPVAKGPVDVRVSRSDKFTRVEFRWPSAVGYRVNRNGRDLLLVFSRGADPDLSLLRVSPPPWVETAESRRVAGGTEVLIRLAEGADAKVGRADGAVYVNVTPPPEPEDAVPAETKPLAAVPTSGVIPVSAAVAGPDLNLGFPFAAPVGAAVFRRGEAIWVVFDANAALDASKLGAHPQVKSVKAVRGHGFTALRIVAPPEVQASAAATGGAWTVTLGPKRRPLAPVAVSVDRDTGPAALSAAVAGSTAVHWIDDPAVGDRLAVVTALGPAKGLAARRAFVETVLLPSSQGLVVQPLADDLSVDADGDLVRVFRPQGLALSGGKVVRRVAAAVDIPRPAAMPAVVDPTWGSLKDQPFLARYDALNKAAAAEGGVQAGGMAARMGLARFLIGADLVHEGLGVLDMLQNKNQALLSDAEFRGLRGAARVMAGREKEAEGDFAAPVLAEDPSSALWRGYIAWTQGDHLRAREQFAQGAPALQLFPVKLRARFARAQAESALAAGDIAGAQAILKVARGWKPPPQESLALSLAQAKVSETAGNRAGALKVYEIVAKAPFNALAAEGELRATQLKLVKGSVKPVDAVKVYEGLRWRWRGDTVELETLRALGGIYVAGGRYREALDVMRSAGSNMPASPVAVAIQNELARIFRLLFLDGGADGLQPVQALALFYDFRELTPVGADGDMMIRRLAQRLIAVDLLGEAAELLKHQAENRLDGVPRAQVATDLAMIYLMDGKPQDALGAIAASRTTVLPTALNLERRVIEARALMQIGRTEHAMEIIGRDTSPDAVAVKAEIYWKQGEWAPAAAALEQSLGRPGMALSAGEEARLLKAAVAYSLAGDERALTRLRARFQPVLATARQPEALRVALSGTDENYNPADLARAVSEADAFSGWVGEMKRRFRAKPATAPQQAKAPTAVAG